MREVRRSALLPYSAGQMYGLVADVLRYPEFLPWCTGAQVLAAEGEFVTVTLGLQRGIARGSFTTRNRLVPERSMEMRLVEGPFATLEGRWDFAPIADAGTRADLLVRFETRGLLGGIALGPAFEQICNQLVDAFARRARQVYRGG
ncbi:MAG TPA: type II toxin-antitoxin system RatA family toxin [Steroidobacteraceae bacterium]|jgi:ribosome-associated toxin RatA of RatAB toxin-antitoxin module